MDTAHAERVTLGLDIGGTNIKSVAVDRHHRVLGQCTAPSRADLSPDKVRESINTVVAYYNDKDIPFEAVGIGCAGSVDTEGGIVRSSPNFEGWTDVPLRSWAQADLKVPAVIHNDANCATFAEWKMGGLEGRNIVFLTFGTGIGGGLIINNQLYYGSTGTAGEIGHTSLYASGPACSCGNSGCFERYCSATTLKEGCGFRCSPREIFQRADEEPFASLLAKFLADLKVAITSLANLFDPDCIVFGGAVSGGISKYLPEIAEWVGKHAFPSVGRHVRLTTAKFGNQSGALGAALLAHDLLNRFEQT